MFRNMEYVYCVYKERSFSKAAEKLHIAQPSLSAMIRKEEEQAGAPIFERKTRPVSLTPFGIEFIRGIEQIYELENHLHDMADELRTLQSGKCKVSLLKCCFILSLDFLSLLFKLFGFIIKFVNHITTREDTCAL